MDFIKLKQLIKNRFSHIGHLFLSLFWSKTVPGLLAFKCYWGRLPYVEWSVFELAEEDQHWPTNFCIQRLHHIIEYKLFYWHGLPALLHLTWYLIKDIPMSLLQVSEYWYIHFRKKILTNSKTYQYASEQWKAMIFLYESWIIHITGIVTWGIGVSSLEAHNTNFRRQPPKKSTVLERMI